MTALDVSCHSQLQELFCFGNRLSKLLVHNCPQLMKLDCGANRLTTLDVSGCAHFVALQCDDNGVPVAPDQNRRFDLSSLPQPPDPANVGAWSGASVCGTWLTVEDGVDRVSYTYRVGDEEDAWVTFSLRLPRTDAAANSAKH